MPFPFTPDILKDTFKKDSVIEKIEESVFYSSVTDIPGKA